MINEMQNIQIFFVNFLLIRGGDVNSYKIKNLRDNYIYKDYEIASINTSVFS